MPVTWCLTQVMGCIRQTTDTYTETQVSLDHDTQEQHTNIHRNNRHSRLSTNTNRPFYPCTLTALSTHTPTPTIRHHTYLHLSLPSPPRPPPHLFMDLRCALCVTEGDCGHILQNGHLDRAVAPVEQSHQRARHGPVADGATRVDAGPLVHRCSRLEHRRPHAAVEPRTAASLAGRPGGARAPPPPPAGRATPAARAHHREGGEGGRGKGWGGWGGVGRMGRGREDG